MRYKFKATGFVLFTLFVFSCTPKEEVVFKGVKNISVEVLGTDPLLKAEALFFNPNSVRMKLKEIHIDVHVEGKPSAEVRQKLKLAIPANADFAVPLEARLALKEIGLLNTVINLMGGKKYTIEYIGFIRVAMHGITIKVPVRHKEELRIKL